MAALVPQETEISLTLGMASKPSDELQEPSSMRLVENLHWRELGGIERKPATDASVAITAPPGDLYAEGQTSGLVARGVDPIVVTDQHGVMAYDTRLAEELWTENSQGRLNFTPCSCEVSRRIVERVQGEHTEFGVFKVASKNYLGVQVLAWITHGLTGATLGLKAIDSDTGRVIAQRELIPLSGIYAHLTACEVLATGYEGVLIAYGSFTTPAAHNILGYRYDYVTNAFVGLGTLQASAGYVAYPRFWLKSANSTSDGYYLAYRDDATGALIVQRRAGDNTVSATHTSTKAVLFGCDIIVGPTNTLIVSTDFSGDLNAEVFGTPANVQTVTGDYATITGALQTASASTHNAVVWANMADAGSGAEPGSSFVDSYEIVFATTTPSLGSISRREPHVWAVGNAYTLRGRAHVTLTTSGYRYSPSSALLPLSFVVVRHRSYSSAGSGRNDPVARIGHDRAFIRSGFAMDTVNVDIFQSATVDANENVWIVIPADPAPWAFEYDTEWSYPQSIMLTRLNMQRPMPVSHAQTAGVVAVADGYPWQFDGDMATELAPVTRPVVEVDVASAGAETGSFGVIAKWAWTDASGRRFSVQSAPVLTGAISSKEINVYVSTCPLAGYRGADSTPAISCEVYITNGTTDVYQLAMNVDGARKVYNSITSNGLWYLFENVTTSYGTGITDARFSTEIAPEPVPAFLHISPIADRLWAVDAEDRTRIWFTKPLLSGVGAEWSTACTLFIGDEAVAVVDVGGFPTVLARGGIYQIGGSGPDANGSGSFAPAQKMPFEVDCIDPVSVCRTPMGVVFRGRRGLYLLGNGLTDTPGLIMDPEMLTDPSLDPSASTSYRLRVVYQEGTSEIHCLTPAGNRLVYNLNEQKWSKYTQSATTTSDIAVARGKLWRADRSFDADQLVSEKLYAEDSTLYNVESAGGWRIDTPWYRLDDVAGQVRLWRVWLALKLASDPADSSISLTYYTEWKESGGQTVTWSGAELAALSSAGDSVVKLPFVPRNQVCSSFKLSISCSISSATACPKPLAMRFQVGARPSKGKRIKGTVKG